MKWLQHLILGFISFVNTDTKCVINSFFTVNAFQNLFTKKVNHYPPYLFEIAHLAAHWELYPRYPCSELFPENFSPSLKITIYMNYLSTWIIVLKLIQCKYVSRVYWSFVACDLVWWAVSYITPNAMISKISWMNEVFQVSRIAHLA